MNLIKQKEYACSNGWNLCNFSICYVFPIITKSSKILKGCDKMSNLDNLVAEILQQAQKSKTEYYKNKKAENLEFTEKENKKFKREVDIIEQKSRKLCVSLKKNFIQCNLKSKGYDTSSKRKLDW